MYYKVVTRVVNGNGWQQETQHRLFARAQDSARCLTSAKHSRERMRHRDDVMILMPNRSITPQSFEF